MVRPIFDPKVTWGSVLVAVSMLVSVSVYMFAPRSASELNAQAIRTNERLIQLAREEDAKQDRMVSEFRAEVVRQLTMQTDALQLLNKHIAELNIRVQNVEQRLERVEKKLDR